MHHGKVFKAYKVEPSEVKNNLSLFDREEMDEHPLALEKMEMLTLTELGMQRENDRKERRIERQIETERLIIER